MTKIQTKALPILLALAALAAGCTTITPAEQRAFDEAKCRSYGFDQRNDAFAECLQRIELDRRAERRASLDRLSWSYDPNLIVVHR